MNFLDTLQSARELLGKHLVHRLPDGQELRGIIVETEAYLADDPACHAFKRQTSRNQWMFGSPVTAYIHINYGIHYCLNVVTNQNGIGEAVLIRAVEPIQGIEIMQQNRSRDSLKDLTNGPGKLTQALQIDTEFNGHDLSHGELYLDVSVQSLPLEQVVTTTRIGITKGAELPYRFYIADNPWVSKK